MLYQSTTGLPHGDILEIAARIREVLISSGRMLRRHVVGLYKQVIITLILLRQNATQALVADLFMISQPTVSRIYRRMIPLLGKVLQFTGISLAEAVRQEHLLLIDGTYIPTGNRPASGRERANYSGKHHVQCLSVQVACTHDGQLVAVSDPVPGSRHDAKAIDLCGWKEILDHEKVNWFADAAYIATTAITPIKKVRARKRLEWEREFNRTVAGFRAPVEHAIAHLKNWKVLAKGYRGRLDELPEVIAVVTKLELFRLGW